MTRHLAGLRTVWDDADREFVRAGNAEHWRRMKRENGWSFTPVEDIPGFVDSVQHLYDYGYSFTDIGTFFGVSRERARQWFNEVPGLERLDGGGASLREWDDDAECFLPVGKEQIVEREQGRAREARKARTEARQTPKRAAHVRMLKNLERELGRVPVLRDLMDATGSTIPVLALPWGRRSEISYADALDKMWAAAGMERPDGRGHMGERHHGAKLTEGDVLDIRRRVQAGETQAVLAREYGVAHPTVSAIVHRKTWRHLEPQTGDER